MMKLIDSIYPLRIKGCGVLVCSQRECRDSIFVLKRMPMIKRAGKQFIDYEH